MNKPNLNYFDVEKYLDSRGIHYDTEGLNISGRGNWIGIRCLWCQDHSNHLGINLDTKGIGCWMCNKANGTVLKLIMKIDRCSTERAIATVKDFSSISAYAKQRITGLSEAPERINKVKIDSMIKKELLSLHREWLIKRRFDPDEIYKKYKLMCCGPIGDFKLRLIIPFYQRSRLITFVARDVTDLAKVPYLPLEVDKSIIPVKSTIYNIETVEDTAVVVEGATDVWRGGDGFVGTMGIKFTREQVLLLSRFKRVFLLFDAEDQAQEQAERLCFALSVVVPEVNNFVLPWSTDPDNMSDDDVKSLRKEIFGRIY